MRKGKVNLIDRAAAWVGKVASPVLLLIMALLLLAMPQAKGASVDTPDLASQTSIALDTTFDWPVDSAIVTQVYGCKDCFSGSGRYEAGIDVHTGVDIYSGSYNRWDYDTPVKAAYGGVIKKVVGLAPQGGGSERIATWDDRNGNDVVDSGEISDLFFTGRTANNHAVGITVVIEHSSMLHTLYGHLHAEVHPKSCTDLTCVYCDTLDQLKHHLRDGTVIETERRDEPAR